MITKAIVRSINTAGNRCVVRMPLFETAANPRPVEAEALVNITPGLFLNLAVDDIVFVAFEENAIDQPIIIGKLFRGADTERDIRGGAGVFDTIKINTSAVLPASTNFAFPASAGNYTHLNSPKKTADYINWLEARTKSLVNQLDTNFRCFKNWTQWQLQPENIEIDDGDLDASSSTVTSGQYQKEGSACAICGNNCLKSNIRNYTRPDTDIRYSEN